MCSDSEAGSYVRLIDFVYHPTLGLRAIMKKVCGGVKDVAVPEALFEAAEGFHPGLPHDLSLLEGNKALSLSETYEALLLESDRNQSGGRRGRSQRPSPRNPEHQAQPSGILVDVSPQPCPQTPPLQYVAVAEALLEAAEGFQPGMPQDLGRRPPHPQPRQQPRPLLLEGRY